MNVGKKSIAVGSLAALSFVAACGSGGQDSGTVTLTVSTGLPAENFFVREYFEPFLADLEEASGGTIAFEHFPSGQLASTPDAVNTVTSGVADMAYFMPGNDPGSHPITAGLTSMPGLYPDSKTGTEVVFELSKEGTIFESDYDRHGIMPVIKFATPAYELWSGGPEINTPDDLRDLRVRNTGGAIGDYLNFVQSNPTQLDTTEIFGALDSGVVDALAIDAVNLESFSLNDLVQRGTKGLGLTGATFGYIMNQASWDRLNDEQKAQFEEAAAELMASYAEYQDENDASLKDSEEFAGIEFVEFDDASRAEWEQSFEDFNMSYLESKDDQFREVYDSFVQRVEQ